VSGMGRLAGRMIGETVRVRLDTGTDIWPVEIDRAQLESAILNLAVNARDAMPLGGRLTIATENVTVGERDHAAPMDLAPGDYVTVSVADTGVGMPPDVAARVFEPFFTTKGAGQGSGLGLSQVYGFINQSHGRVRIDSAVGLGTVVTLYIPRAFGAEADAAGAGPTVPTAPASATVLVVDDNEDLRQIAVQQIKEMGYRVLEAPDAAQALELISSGTPIDLLFTDIVLPGGIDGRALAWAAREVRPQLKLLFTSGFADLEVGGEGPPDVEMLAKPYRRATLAHALHRVLAK
jgi:CheY-like chemotaxis protein